MESSSDGIVWVDRGFGSGVTVDGRLEVVSMDMELVDIGSM